MKCFNECGLLAPFNTKTIAANYELANKYYDRN